MEQLRSTYAHYHASSSAECSQHCRLTEKQQQYMAPLRAQWRLTPSHHIFWRLEVRKGL